MRIKETVISGCYEIEAEILSDSRGALIKIFNYEEYRRYGLGLDLKEEYYSISSYGVIRGLHFQSPPMDHLKLVYCVSGDVLDVLLDLRRGSPSYGMVHKLRLSADKANAVYIPSGIAHGFCVLSQEARMIYKTTSGYSKDHDNGILYNSIDIDWPIESPIISSRDLSFLPFSNFQSPFTYHGE